MQRTAKRHRKQFIRYGLLFANVVLLISVIVFIRGNQSSKGLTQKPANSSITPALTNSVASNPLDQLSSADIAVHVARVAKLEEATSVTNKADTVNAQMAISSTDDVVASKPQVISNGLKSKKDITRYNAQQGDTITSVANKFGVTTDSIRWSNGLSSETIVPGTSLVIPPVNGIVYQVKAGDNVDSLASRYRANRNYIAAFNDAETTGLIVGDLIVIPDGIQPSVYVGRSTVSTISTSGAFAWGGYGPIYNSNGYDYGYCTWWAATRRSQIGRPIPSNLGNASTWKILAQRAGLGVGGAPAAGAVIWTPPRDYYGHVGFVESVNPDGSVNISEMNVAGWGRVSNRTLSAQEAAGYSYIY